MHRESPIPACPLRVLWGAFGLLAAGLLLAAYLSGGDFAYSDERDYLEIASNIAEGRGFSQNGRATAFRPPAWPLLLAGAIALGASTTVLALIPVLLLVASALLARLIAARIAGEVAGWVAAFGMMLYPLNAYTALTLYPQILATALTLLMLWLVISADGRSSGGRAALLGVSAATLILAVPTMALVAAVIGLWALWGFRRQWLKFALVGGVACVLPVAAWTARNQAELGSPIPVSTATGINLLLGNSENTGPDTGVGVDIRRYVEPADAQKLDEVGRNDLHTAQARAWVQENPADAAVLYVRKVLNYFAPYNVPQTADGGSATAALVSYFTFVPLVVLALLRLLVARRRFPLRSPEAVMWTLFLSNAAFMAITFTRARFRQPLDSMLIIEAAVLVAVFVAAPAARRRPSALEGAAASLRP